MPALSVNIVGTGNVAEVLSRSFHEAGVKVGAIAGRNPTKTRALAETVGAEAMRYPEPMPSADVTLIAVSDRAVPEVAAALPQSQLKAHTSGSVSLDAMGPGRTGVWYPLQTFTQGKHVDWSDLPLCVEASNAQDFETLRTLAEALGAQVRSVDSKQRAQLHLAAVFACNFPNTLYQIASDLLEANGLSLDLLRPLISETTQKVMQHPPEAAQTGPARRNDVRILQSHLEALSDHPDWQALYTQLTNQILQRYHGSEL